MTVAFHTNTLFFRGSEAALWDYAVLNESVLGNRSVICFRESPELATSPVAARWRTRFAVLAYRSRRHLASQLQKVGASALYMIKPGPWDGLVVPGVINCVHAMFLSEEFHGDRFAYVSPWASRVMTGREDSHVPHLVPRLESEENLRKQLQIPAGARVFGRHGGWDTFNIPFVHREVFRHARSHPRDHFVFLNTKPIRGTESLANVHYLPGTADPARKAAFLATCDAMIHGRDTGETFGLAVGEFAVLGKPVITFGLSRERAHLEMLGKEGRIYNDGRRLRELLADLQPGQAPGTGYETWTDASRVMAVFAHRFLN